MTRRRIRFYRAALRSCGLRSEPRRVRAGSRSGEKVLGCRSPGVVGMKGLRGLRHLCGLGELCAGASLWESLDRARVCGAPLRFSPNKRNGVSPGAAWVLPIGSPHPRSACVPSLGGFYADLCGRCSVSTPAGRCVKPSPASEDLGERRPSPLHHLGKRQQTGSCP